jgi:hypothetical protein
MDFNEFCNRLKYQEREQKLSCLSYWQAEADNHVTISIQGDSEKPDKDYLDAACMMLGDLQLYHTRAIRHLERMLKPDYRYYCHSIYFHEYPYGILTRKGFEMLFWQEEPNDDRYVNYVVQFSKNGYDIGLRIFSW